MQVDHDEERAVSVQVSESKWSTGNAIERSADLAAPAAPSSPVAVWPPSTLEEWRLVPPDIPSLPIGRARLAIYERLCCFEIKIDAIC